MIQYLIGESGALFSSLCCRFGNSIGKNAIIRMVARGEVYSRAGIGGLQNLYDKWGERTRDMKLSKCFFRAENLAGCLVLLVS